MSAKPWLFEIQTLTGQESPDSLFPDQQRKISHGEDDHPEIPLSPGKPEIEPGEEPERESQQNEPARKPEIEPAVTPEIIPQHSPVIPELAPDA